MATATNAFPDLPGMDAIKELQRRLDPSWMKQQEQIELALRMAAGSLSAYHAELPDVLNRITATSRSLYAACACIPSPNMLETAKQAQALRIPNDPLEGLQPALLISQKNMNAICDTINSAVYRYALTERKEYIIAHVRSLTETISDIETEDDKEPIALPTEFSDEDEQILANEVASIFASDKNWEQRLADSMEKFKETHPVLVWALCYLILPILLGLLVNFISTTIGEARTSAKVYELPQTSSSVVYHLEPLQQVKIVGEEPYYFQIELTNSETQETFVGFVSKRSLKEVERQDAS